MLIVFLVLSMIIYLNPACKNYKNLIKILYFYKIIQANFMNTVMEIFGYIITC